MQHQLTSNVCGCETRLADGTYAMATPYFESRVVTKLSPKGILDQVRVCTHPPRTLTIAFNKEFQWLIIALNTEQRGVQKSIDSQKS